MNEPVAWTNQNELDKYSPIIAEKDYSIHFPIPLYTHPAKTLTDEEIIQEIELLPSNISMEDKDYINFARAILRKAQEK